MGEGGRGNSSEALMGVSGQLMRRVVGYPDLEGWLVDEFSGMGGNQGDSGLSCGTLGLWNRVQI